MAYFNQKKILQVVKTEYVPAVYQEKTITPQNQTREITADTGYAALSKVILDGLLVDPHESYTTSTDSTTAYSKSVPSGALKYATLDKVGCMSYKCFQLLNIPNVAETTTSQGVKFKIENNTIYLIDGTATANTNILILSFTLPAGTYYFKSFSESGSNSTYLTYIQKIVDGQGQALKYSYDNGSFTLTETTTMEYRFIVRSGTSVSNITFKDMLVSGSTAPTTYQTYFEGIRDSAVTSLVSKDSNNTTIDTNTIPAEVQALEGYGWGINDTCYNYIDYENKKFIKKVGRVDLGTLNYSYNAGYGSFFSNSLNNSIKHEISGSVIATALCELYEIITASQAYQNLIDMGLGVNEQGNLFITNSNYTTAETFKTAMSGVYLYYELATPVETDISSYIDNEFIEVAAGGSLTFNNTYNQAVPSEVTYLVEV